MIGTNYTRGALERGPGESLSRPCRQATTCVILVPSAKIPDGHFRRNDALAFCGNPSQSHVILAGGKTQVSAPCNRKLDGSERTASAPSTGSVLPLEAPQRGSDPQVREMMKGLRIPRLWSIRRKSATPKKCLPSSGWFGIAHHEGI